MSDFDKRVDAHTAELLGMLNGLGESDPELSEVSHEMFQKLGLEKHVAMGGYLYFNRTFGSTRIHVEPDFNCVVVRNGLGTFELPEIKRLGQLLFLIAALTPPDAK